IFFKTLPATSTYTLSLHDALPIFRSRTRLTVAGLSCAWTVESELTIKHENNKTSGGLCMECTWRCDFLHRHSNTIVSREDGTERSEEHTSELQSLRHLVCRLLLEK